MSSQMGSIIRKSTRKDGEPLNILSWVVHERYQSCLAKSNCAFYLLQNGNGCKGNWKKEYASIPRNHVILEPYQNNPLEVIPSWVDIDLVWSQHKFGLVQAGLQIANHLGVGLVNVEHTMCTSPQLEQAKPELKKLNGDINVFISAFNRDNWGYSENEAEVIEHGIDSKVFKPANNVQKKNQIITVGNDMLNRSYILGWDIVQEVVLKNNLPINVVGDTQGFSQPAKNTFDLVRQLNESTIYFCPSRLSPISTSLLEGMACGLCPVTTDNCVKSELIVDGVNGFKSNDNNVLLNHLNRLLANPDEAKEIGQKARETVMSRYSLDRFVNQWNSVFERASQIRK